LERLLLEGNPLAEVLDKGNARANHPSIREGSSSTATAGNSDLRDTVKLVARTVLADARVFKKADGLSWMDSAGRTFTLSWPELRDWVGVRAQSGRLVPKGFPRSNSFGPAF
jgi:hypothetical protein